MDTELKATAAIKDLIAESDYLEAFIREKDKEPCWDGYVCIHSDKHYSKVDIKKVNIQVKGLAINPRKVKEHIYFPVEHNDLIAFLNDGGAIFFVVYINKTTRKSLQIYYTNLLPIYIKKLIGTQKPKYSIRFKKFPTDIKTVEDLFLTFYEDSRKQASFSEAEIIPPSIMAEKHDFTGFSFSISGMHRRPTLAELPRYLEDKSLSLYGHLTNINIPIPVDYIDEIHNIKVSQQVNIPVQVNGIQYYDTFCRSYFKDKTVLQIGSCVTVTIHKDENDKETPPYQVNYKLAGTLSERIKGLEFIRAAIQNKGLSLGKADFSINDDDGFKSFNMDKLTNILKGYHKAKQALESSSIVKELDLDHFTDDDYAAFNKFIASVVDKEPIKGHIAILNRITALKIGNLNLAVVYTPNSADSYIIWDIFHARLNAKVINSKGEEIHVSQFIWMTKEDFLQYDNLNLSFILEDFQSIPLYKELYNDAALVALELIKAYDQSKDESFLDSANKFFDWIEEKNGIPQEIIMINQLQIALRRRKLSYEENCQLHDLIKTTTDLSVKCCAFLLLDQQEEAQKILDSFDEETLMYFKEFPIYYFYQNMNSASNV